MSWRAQPRQHHYHWDNSAKHSCYLAIGLCLVAMPGRVSAAVIAVDVTRANIKTQPLVFDVRTEKRKANIHFIFTVRETSELSRYHDAGIALKHGKQTIVECHLKPYRKEKQVAYEITVSPQMLGTSRFTLFNIGGNDDVPFPSGTIYRFHLKEFYQEEAEAEDKPANRGGVRFPVDTTERIAALSQRQAQNPMWNRITKSPKPVLEAVKTAQRALPNATAGPVANLPIVELHGKITGKTVVLGQDVTANMTIRSTEDKTHKFRLGSQPQVFGVYILGPWGPVAPDATRVRPENWMHQQHSAAQTISISRKHPYRTDIKLNDYFSLNDRNVFRPGRYQVNIKFYDNSLGMKAPVDSGALVFDVVDVDSLGRFPIHRRRNPTATRSRSGEDSHN